MKPITMIFLVFVFFSCRNGENIEPTNISLEDAIAEQFISFTLGDRDISLTEFKEDSWPFHGTIVWPDSIEFDSLTEYPISRAIYAFIPDDQSPDNHIETFGLEFNQVFFKNDVDMDSKQVISNEKFREDFLQIGKQNHGLSNFGFHRTYSIGSATHTSSLMVTDIEHILEHDNMIFVSGEFSSPGYFDGYKSQYQFNLGAISNGKFKVIIEN